MGADFAPGRRVVRVAAAIALATGALALIGWVARIPALRSVGPTWVSMRPVTAIALLLLASSLWLPRAGEPGRVALVLMRLAAGLAALLGLLTVAESLSAAAPNIDRLLLWHRVAEVQVVLPGRMSLPAALAVALLGVAGLLSGRRSHAMRVAAEALAIAAGVTAMLLLTGYVFEIVPGESSRLPTSLAVNSAVGLVALSVASLAGSPEATFVTMLRADPPGGVVVRRVLPAVLVAILLVGWLGIRIERLGVYTSEFGNAVQALAAMVLVCVVMLWGSIGLNRTEEDRRRAQEQAAASEARYRNTLDGMLEGCQIVGPDWRYRYVNDAAAAHGRQPKTALLGRTMTELYPGIEQTPMFACLKECMERRTPRRLENEFRYADGSIAWFALSMEPVPEGVFIISLDVSEQKRAQEEVRRLNADLERRVEERTAELKASNAELEAFTYSVSHDLRAPLRQADGFAKILLDDYAAALEPDARHYLERVREGTRLMGQLVDELLNFSRLGRRVLSLQTVGLDTVVREALEELRPATEGRRIEWKIAGLPLVECDPVLMHQVFVNLLSNAVKFTRPRDCAVIEIGQVAHEGSTAVFVRDNGVGFNPKYADKLFGVFQRLHRQEDFEGTGVGLATVLRIVQKHGGRVWAEGELNRGATFYFALGDAGGAS